MAVNNHWNKQQQLRDAVKCLLEINSQPLSEYQLLQLLRDQGWELPTHTNDSVALFNSHFLLFHVLYTLQQDYWASGQYLEISALNIQLHSMNVAGSPDKDHESNAVLYRGDQSLRDYYLDLSHLETATEASVNDLLNQFWGKYLALDERVEALEVLSLPPTTSYQEIKNTYRRLAMIHHPDRGGDVATFQSINRAFGVLQRLHHQ